MYALLLAAVASAADAPPIKSCVDSAASKDVTWMKARTVRLEVVDGSGTGVVISPDGFVLTAAHVVAGASEVSVVFDDDRELPGVVVGSAPESDLALIRLEERDVPCLPAGTDPVEVGSDVFVIGSPGGAALSHTVSKGIVSAVREVEGRAVVQTDATINPGNSGGPMISASGDLIGIVSFKMVGEGLEGLGFAVPAASAPDVLGFSWADETAPSWFEAAVVGEELTGAVVLPTVTRPGGTPVQPARYELQYRPTWVNVGLGAVGVAVGGAMVASTYGKYKGTDAMSERSWNKLKTTNSWGWVSLLAGGAYVGLGFALPTKNAPVIITPIEEAR